MKGDRPSHAATPAVLPTTFVCPKGRPHLITQGCTCPSR